MLLRSRIKQIEANIRSNPVQDFDLSRVVNVFTARIQFVELGVEGANLEAHTVKLPAELSHSCAGQGDVSVTQIIPCAFSRQLPVRRVSENPADRLSPTWLGSPQSGSRIRARSARAAGGYRSSLPYRQTTG